MYNIFYTQVSIKYTQKLMANAILYASKAKPEYHVETPKLT